MHSQFSGDPPFVQDRAARWRFYEKVLIDYFRRHCGPLRDVCGRPSLVAEFHDDDTGELLAVRHVVDVEALARELSYAERETLNRIRDRVWHE
jgi:hypothetical protein